MATPSNIGGFTNPISRLLLQSKKPIDAALCGAEETTLEYVLKNESYPTLVPARGTSPADVTPAVSGISAFDHLGKESHRFTHNGKAPGLGILQVKYRGAIIGDSGATDPEETDTFSLLGFSAPYVYEDATAGNADTPSTRSLSYRAPGRRFHYVSRNKPDTPVFALQGPVPGGAATLSFTVSGDTITTSDDHTFIVGDRLRFINSDTATAGSTNLPAPLNTIYSVAWYVVDVPSSTTLKIRSVPLFSLGPDEDPVSFTTSGSGTHYINFYSLTPPALDETDVSLPYTVTLPDGRIYTYTSRWALTQFDIVTCGRFFEITEADQAKIIETITHV